MNGALDPRTVARVLGGDIIGRNRVNVPGPGHSPGDRSLSITIDPAAPQGFWVHSFSPRDDWRDCRDHIAAALGIKFCALPSRPTRGSQFGMQSTVPDDTVDADDPSEFPLKIWSETTSAPGTLAEKHLASRELALPDRHEEVLRFHPSCVFGRGTRHPCMVALYRDIKTNEPKAIHRTALTRDGTKIDRKALGPKGGCAIKLSADEDVTQGLTIAEGLETALAGIQLDFRPTWALGDAGGIERFPVLPGIDCLTILVDNDASGTGQGSALKCSGVWSSAGREVRRVIPRTVGEDLADIVARSAA